MIDDLPRHNLLIARTDCSPTEDRHWTNPAKGIRVIEVSKSRLTDDGVAFKIALPGLPKVEVAVSDSCE